jgi:hypothetical protein
MLSIMKHTTIASTFAITVATALALGIAPPAQAADKGCSNATLKGTFVYTNTGFLTAPTNLAGPFAGVGTQNFDGNGGTTATAWVSQNGNIVQATIKGTYTVNPDCTGTFALQVSVQSPPLSFLNHVFFVINENGAEFRAINTDPGEVITTVGKRQFPEGDWRQ